MVKKDLGALREKEEEVSRRFELYMGLICTLAGFTLGVLATILLMAAL